MLMLAKQEVRSAQYAKIKNTAVSVKNEVEVPRIKGAYAEVISYNRKNLERELQNESRQSNRQQSRTKRREEEI